MLLLHISPEVHATTEGPIDVAAAPDPAPADFWRAIVFSGWGGQSNDVFISRISNIEEIPSIPPRWAPYDEQECTVGIG